ncbi:hypothetical protein BB561_005897 [Smittium simulii]|uniref:ABC transporter domain-containing protein n=1 Tax=Smittium simulii TaxID=133385 RepID=A0A2T9Y7P7_9FUNG|nr:hypothetical protein BB561_005897 [Smittium simulii]
MPTLEFSGICYEVKKGGGKKSGYRTILDNIGGKMIGGELTAIIGSSGAGKTTLLNILSGRIISGKLSGNVKLDGAKRIPRQFKRDVAYVEQEDLLYSGLTVRETLAYSASFRLDSKEYTTAMKESRVDTMIHDLMLEKCKESIVQGINGRGVSGGEKKRTSIGVEILSDPKLIMLDEPTSGLDSSNAETLVRLVKKITMDNKIISVASIHQPSSRVFNMFDNVIILCAGKIVYSGPVSKAIGYFESIGYSCPKYENPADFFINLITVDTQSAETTAESNKRINMLINEWQNTSGNFDHIREKAESKDSTPGDNKNKDLKIEYSNNTKQTDFVMSFDNLFEDQKPNLELLPKANMIDINDKNENVFDSSHDEMKKSSESNKIVEKRSMDVSNSKNIADTTENRPRTSQNTKYEQNQLNYSTMTKTEKSTNSKNVGWNNGWHNYNNNIVLVCVCFDGIGSKQNS